MKKEHLCLAFHAMREDIATPEINSNLFISVSEMDHLMGRLQGLGYKFVLPEERDKFDKTCSVTFDDGYANNALFLKIAEKYSIPFVVFLSGINIEKGLPFLWDLKESEKNNHWSWKKDDYERQYLLVQTSTIDKLRSSEHYRPFTLKELTDLSKSSLFFISNHTFSHTPFSSSYSRNFKQEIDFCKEYFKNFKNYLSEDIALPCGLFTLGWMEELKKNFKRIYTINEGVSKIEGQVIHRVSLESPLVAGDLLAQIEKSMKPKRYLKKKLSMLRHSYI